MAEPWLAERFDAVLAVRRARATVLSSLVFVAVALALASCGAAAGESPAEKRDARRVAVVWLKAMAEADIKKACRLMDAENHSPHQGFPNWSPTKNCQELWLHSNNTPLDWKPSDIAVTVWGDSNPKVLRVTIEGNQAIVYIDGVDQERPVWLRKEHGRWLVDHAEYPI